MWVVGYGLLLFKNYILITWLNRLYWLVAVDVYLNDALMQLYLFLMSFTPSNLRLDFKQLGSEFSQDARSNRAR